jgi:hypothetical protein
LSCPLLRGNVDKVLAPCQWHIVRSITRPVGQRHPHGFCIVIPLRFRFVRLVMSLSKADLHFAQSAVSLGSSIRGRIKIQAKLWRVADTVLWLYSVQVGRDSTVYGKQRFGPNRGLLTLKMTLRMSHNARYWGVNQKRRLTACACFDLNCVERGNFRCLNVGATMDNAGKPIYHFQASNCEKIIEPEHRSG